MNHLLGGPRAHRPRAHRSHHRRQTKIGKPRFPRVEESMAQAWVPFGIKGLLYLSQGR